jgi:hypothetical protein
MSGFSQLNPVPVANGGTGDTGSAWTALSTPTVTVGAGGAVTTTSVAGSFKTIGKTCFFRLKAVISANTATGWLNATLVGAPNTNGEHAFAATWALTGAGGLVGMMSSGTNAINITKTDGSVPTGTGTIYVSGCYETA